MARPESAGPMRLFQLTSEPRLKTIVEATSQEDVEQFDVWLKRRFAETRSHGAIVRGQFGRNAQRDFSHAVSIRDGSFERPGQGTDERNHVAEDRNRPPALFLGRDQLGLRVSRGSHLK